MAQTFRRSTHEGDSMRRRVKRALDVTVANDVLMVTAPISGGIAVATRPSMGSPPRHVFLDFVGHRLASL